MKIDAVTIFPEYFAPAQLSLLGKAQNKGLVDIQVHDLRTFTSDNHNTVDDTPYGGGAGMVMLAEIWGKALDPLMVEDTDLIVLTPAGKRFSPYALDKRLSPCNLAFALPKLNYLKFQWSCVCPFALEWSRFESVFRPLCEPAS